jgi:sugar phosphate isomerase/epimerase
MRRLSLTSWSLHRLIQDTLKPSSAMNGNGGLRLLDVPARIREAGIGTLEICHFHLPSTDPAYLAELRAAIEDAGVELFSILIDTGNIAQADQEQREADLRMIEGWIDVAAELGARAVRVIAGDADPGDQQAIERSIAGLDHLAGYAARRGIRVLTENFRSLASTADNCNAILDALEGKIGLCADIGNFPADTRVAEFAAVVARAESVHAKASYDAMGRIEPAQLRQCLDASVEAGFSGPYTLVFDKEGDTWAGITELKRVVEPATT